MSAALLDELLAAFAAPTVAKVANLANREQRRGPAADSAACEGLRNLANPADAQSQKDLDSQTFASIRKPQDGPESEERRVLSQDSQD